MTQNKLSPEQMSRYLTIVDEVENLRSLSDKEKEKLVRDILEKPFLDLLCDVAFKYVFEQNPDSLLMLLNDLLPEKIVSITTNPNELVSPVIADKKPVLDILAETKDGRKIIIEMQQERRKAFFPRLYYYGSKLLTGQLKRGSHYSKLMPVIVICFTNFTTKHDGCPEDQLVYEYEHRERVGGEPFTTLHKTYICELPRLANKAPAEMGPVESWFYLLKNICNFAKKPEGIDSRYDNIIEAAKTNLVPDKERTQYLRAMLSDYDKQDIGQAYYELGREEEREIWLKKEVEWKQRLKKTVKRMLEKGNGVTTISEYLGLTPEEVDALATPSND